MKNLAVILFAAMLAVFCTNAQRIQEKDIPATVKSALQRQYSDVTKVEWSKEENNYETGFEVGETEYFILLDASGVTIETGAEISIDSLPATIKDYVPKNYPEQKIKKVAKITDAKGTVTYEAEVRKDDLIFDDNGRFIMQKEAENDKD